MIGAQIEAVMAHGEPAWFENALVPIFRNGRMEEVFWTYSYSPAFDDTEQIFGTLVIVTEMTGRVLASRRLEALGTLAAALAQATTYEDAFAAVAAMVTSSAADLPFVIASGPKCVEAHAGLGLDPPAELAALLRHAPRGEVRLKAGPVGSVWPESVRTALTASVGTRGDVLALGASPRLPLDHAYRSFLTQIVERVASTLHRIDNQLASRVVQRQRDNLLLHAPVATALLVGPHHVFELANPLYRELVGRDPTGKSFREAFPELDDTAMPGILDRVYRTGEPFSVSEMRVPLHRDDAPRDCFFNFNLEPLRDEGDRVYGMMAVAIEITAQVAARHALEQANRTKDDFLAMLGHELRNPLAPIVTALELMRTKENSGERSSEIGVIERQVQHVVRLVDDLLDVSKITRGVLALDKRPVDISSVVRAALETSAHLIDVHHHQLEVDMAAGIFVDGDEARLHQVVSNLLTNAARYTPDGGKIRVRVTATPTDVAVEVHDNGVGIAADLLPRVFDSFVQGARGTDRSEGGLGLGLAIVKSLVALHGGEVTAESPGTALGSTFTVRLPRAAAALRHEPVAAPRTAGTKRILVVDDNEDAADLLGELVRMHGHDVTVVHDPYHALAVVGALRPEVALLDIGLPGMDGYELASQVRARLPDCRLIALTGYGQAGDRERASTAGFAAHLVKPINVTALLPLLE